MKERHICILWGLDSFIPLDIINIIKGYDYYLELRIVKVITDGGTNEIYSIGNNTIIYDNILNQINISDSDPRNNLKLTLNSLKNPSTIIYSFPDTQNIILNSFDDRNHCLEFYYPPYNLKSISKDRKFLIKFEEPESVNFMIQLPNLDYCIGMESGDIQIWGESNNDLVLKYTLNGHGSPIIDIIIVPSTDSFGFSLISLSEDKIIKIWDMETHITKLILKDELPNDDAHLKYLGENKILYISDTNIIIWNYIKGLKINMIDLSDINITSTLLLDDKIFIRNSNKIIILSAKTLNTITQVNYPNSRNLQILPDNNIIMTDYYGLVSILNTKTYEIDHTFQTYGNAYNICVLPNGLCAINKETHIEILE